MLNNFDVVAAIAVDDVAAAKKFYQDVLGLKLESEFAGGLYFSSAKSGLLVYESEFAGTNKATYAGWHVKDIDSVVKGLKDKGVSFEHYDNLGELDGDVHVMGKMKSAWFKDPAGNILSVSEM